MQQKKCNYSLFPPPTYYLIVDLEATCGEEMKEMRDREIIEIGAVLVDQNFNTMDTFQAFVKPKINPVLTDFCTTLTDISQSQVNEARDFTEVYESFKIWVFSHDSYNVKFYAWGSFDGNMLDLECQRRNKKKCFFVKNTPESRINLKTALLHKHKLRNDRVGSLDQACERLGIQWEGAHHRALDDALNTAKILPFVVGEKKPPNGVLEKSTQHDVRQAAFKP